jgi:hypothetical protein
MPSATQGSRVCCRDCLEVRCRSAGIPVGGEWDKLDRRNVCRNDKIVKVKITDTCASMNETPEAAAHMSVHMEWPVPTGQADVTRFVGAGYCGIQGNMLASFRAGARAPTPTTRPPMRAGAAATTRTWTCRSSPWRRWGTFWSLRGFFEGFSRCSHPGTSSALAASVTEAALGGAWRAADCCRLVPAVLGVGKIPAAAKGCWRLLTAGEQMLSLLRADRKRHGPLGRLCHPVPQGGLQRACGRRPGAAACHSLPHHQLLAAPH